MDSQHLIPFSIRLQDTTSVKEVNEMRIQMKNSIISKLSIDKRTIRESFEKIILKAKIDLHCKLYRLARDRQIALIKQQGNYYSGCEPETLEKVLRDFNWEKSVNYSKYNEEDEEDMVPKAETYLGSQKEEEPISPDKESCEKNEVNIRDLVEFYFAGDRLNGEVLGVVSEGLFSVEVKDENRKTRYQVKRENIISTRKKPTPVPEFDEEFAELALQETPIPEVVKEEAENISREKKVFKELDLEIKKKLISDIMESGIDKCGKIKNILQEEYIISHYDDVYIPFIKVRGGK